MTLTGSVQYSYFNDDFNHHNETLQNEALARFTKEGRSLETVLKELYGGQKAFDVGAWMRSRYAELLAKQAAEQEDAAALEASRRPVNPLLTANAAQKNLSPLWQDMHHTPPAGLQARYQTMQNLWQQASQETLQVPPLMMQQNILANPLSNPLANTLVNSPLVAQAMPQARYPQTPVSTKIYPQTPLPQNNAVDWSAYQHASRQNQAAYQAFQQAHYNQAREAQQAALQNKLEALEKHQKELLRQQRWKRFEEEQDREKQAIAAKLAAEKRHAEKLQQQALLNTRPLDENATLQQMMMGTHPQNIMVTPELQLSQNALFKQINLNINTPEYQAKLNEMRSYSTWLKGKEDLYRNGYNGGFSSAIALEKLTQHAAQLAASTDEFIVLMNEVIIGDLHVFFLDNHRLIPERGHPRIQLGDLGINSAYQDHTPYQMTHFWAYVNYGYLLPKDIAKAGNLWHEYEDIRHILAIIDNILQGKRILKGSEQDYNLGALGINIGQALSNNDLTPAQLSYKIHSFLKEEKYNPISKKNIWLGPLNKEK